MARKKPAFIDLSITCMGCDTVLFQGVYTPGIISKLRKLIRREGWIHHPSEGTLCPECAKELETTGRLFRRNSEDVWLEDSGEFADGKRKSKT